MAHNNLKRVLIESPVNQNPKVLKEFLDSLSRLKKNSIQTDIMFINDNESQESIQLLREYEKQHSSVKVFDTVYENERRELYSWDENSHIWRDSLIWKVAQFKNIIIKSSIEP